MNFNVHEQFMNKVHEQFMNKKGFMIIVVHEHLNAHEPFLFMNCSWTLKFMNITVDFQFMNCSSNVHEDMMNCSWNLFMNSSWNVHAYSWIIHYHLTGDGLSLGSSSCFLWVHLYILFVGLNFELVPCMFCNNLYFGKLVFLQLDI